MDQEPRPPPEDRKVIYVEAYALLHTALKIRAARTSRTIQEIGIQLFERECREELAQLQGGGRRGPA